MKKYRVAIGLVMVIAIYLVLNLFFPMDGYYFDIDDARSKDEDYREVYQSYDYMFTWEKEGEVVDFLITDQSLQLIKIDIKKRLNKPSYSIRGYSAAPISQYIEEFHDENDYHWNSTDKLTSPYLFEWCIVSKTFNEQNDKEKAYDFSYDGEDYCLCYREPSNN